MFEKYTEKARRVIFYARYEVSEFGSQAIEPEHLLLGLLREDKPLVARFLPRGVSIETIREQVGSRMIRDERISTSVEIPLSQMSKDVLKYAHEESENLGNRHVGTEHILLGMLRQKESVAERVLRENGLELAGVRQQIKDNTE